MNSMAVEVESCKRKEVVEMCNLLLEMANMMVEVVVNCKRKEVVETYSQPLVQESRRPVVGESYTCRAHRTQQPLWP